MNGKCDVPPEKKQKKVDRMKCQNSSRNGRGKIKQCHEKSSYSYYRPLSYHVAMMWYEVRVRAASDRQSSSALANAIFIRHNRNYFD